MIRIDWPRNDRTSFWYRFWLNFWLLNPNIHLTNNCFQSPFAVCVLRQRLFLCYCYLELHFSVASKFNQAKDFWWHYSEWEWILMKLYSPPSIRPIECTFKYPPPKTIPHSQPVDRRNWFWVGTQIAFQAFFIPLLRNHYRSLEHQSFGSSIFMQSNFPLFFFFWLKNKQTNKQNTDAGFSALQGGTPKPRYIHFESLWIMNAKGAKIIAPNFCMRGWKVFRSASLLALLLTRH